MTVEGLAAEYDRRFPGQDLPASQAAARMRRLRAASSAMKAEELNRRRAQVRLFAQRYGRLTLRAIREIDAGLEPGTPSAEERAQHAEVNRRSSRLARHHSQDGKRWSIDRNDAWLGSAASAGRNLAARFVARLRQGRAARVGNNHRSRRSRRSGHGSSDSDLGEAEADHAGVVSGLLLGVRL
jgi:hypothetical protein